MKVSYAFYRIQISSAVSKLFKFSQDLFFLNTLIYTFNIMNESFEISYLLLLIRNNSPKSIPRLYMSALVSYFLPFSTSCAAYLICPLSEECD